MLAAISMSFSYTFSQNPERILQKQSNSLKEPTEAALNLFNKGLTLSNNKEYILSNRDYEMAIALDSDYIDAYNNLGLNFYEMNLMDSARYYLMIEYISRISWRQDQVLATCTLVGPCDPEVYYPSIPHVVDGTKHFGRHFQYQGSLAEVDPCPAINSVIIRCKEDRPRIQKLFENRYDRICGPSVRIAFRFAA